ncbi:hypothetical protein KAR10_02460, partial [bacterium]|nr:hypothetical protein [bacterium]
KKAKIAADDAFGAAFFQLKHLKQQLQKLYDSYNTRGLLIPIKGIDTHVFWNPIEQDFDEWY